MKNNGLINLLEEKYMDNDTINAILKYISNHNIDVVEKINSIYDIFDFVGLSNEYIEVLIRKTIGILDCSKSELVKIAYVLNEVNLNDEIFSKVSIANGIINYKRVFMRDLISKLSGRFKTHKGVDFLTVGDNYAYGSKYNLNKSCDVLQKGIYCDEALENVLSKYLKFDGNNVTVDEYLDKMATRFYLKFLLYKNKKAKENGLSVK